MGSVMSKLTSTTGLRVFSTTRSAVTIELTKKPPPATPPSCRADIVAHFGKDGGTGIHLRGDYLYFAQTP